MSTALCRPSLTDHSLENISQQCMRAVVEVDMTLSGYSFMLCRHRIQPSPVSRLPVPVSRDRLPSL